MEVLIENDRKRLGGRLRYAAGTMEVLSRILASEATKIANDMLVAEIRDIAEELYPTPTEHKELRRDWDMENTYVRYNRGDVFATLHHSSSHDILALSLIKYDQANFSADVVLPEHVSRKITSKRAWFLIVDHLAENHRLSAQRSVPNERP